MKTSRIHILFVIIVVLFAVWSLVPVLWMLLASFKTQREMITITPPRMECKPKKTTDHSILTTS